MVVVLVMVVRGFFSSPSQASLSLNPPARLWEQCSGSARFEAGPFLGGMGSQPCVDLSPSGKSQGGGGGGGI